MIPAWSRSVFLIGLTGAIGSGKSTAARLFEKHGAVVIDADRLAKDALLLPEVQEKLRLKFPDAFAGSKLDNKLLADIVFENSAKLAELTAITHPVVRGQFEARAKSAPPGTIVVYDVPLLFEAGLEKDFDLTVCVSAGEDLRHRRLLARGLSENDIKRREGLQLKAAEKENRAGFVLNNDGGEADLEARITSLLHQIEARRTV